MEAVNSWAVANERQSVKIVRKRRDTSGGVGGRAGRENGCWVRTLIRSTGAGSDAASQILRWQAVVAYGFPDSRRERTDFLVRLSHSCEVEIGAFISSF